MTSQVGVLGAESYLILSCNYHSPLLLKVLSDKQALVDEVIEKLVTLPPKLPLSAPPPQTLGKAAK